MKQLIKRLLKSNDLTYKAALRLYNSMKAVRTRLNSLSVGNMGKCLRDPGISIFIDTHSLFSKEMRPGGFNRMDTVVRYMAIEEYYACIPAHT